MSLTRFHVQIFDAMLEQRIVKVTTKTRSFSGMVVGLYTNPFESELVATVCDSDGRVHSYRPLREDAKTEFP